MLLTRARVPRRDPFMALTRDMDRLFESMFMPTGRLNPAEPQPRWISAPLNISEDENNVYVETEIPGVKLDNIEILASSDELTIKGSREVSLPENARWLRRERSAGSFERKTTLPSEIDVEKVEAQLRDGVLMLTMPKVEAERPRKIAVKALTKGKK